MIVTELLKDGKCNPITLSGDSHYTYRVLTFHFLFFPADFKSQNM